MGAQIKVKETFVRSFRFFQVPQVKIRIHR
jgi:hypothetical protein